MEHGAKPNIKDGRKDTAMALAQEKKLVELVEVRTGSRAPNWTFLFALMFGFRTVVARGHPHSRLTFYLF